MRACTMYIMPLCKLSSRHGHRACMHKCFEKDTFKKLKQINFCANLEKATLLALENDNGMSATKQKWAVALQKEESISGWMKVFHRQLHPFSTSWFRNTPHRSSYPCNWPCECWQRCVSAASPVKLRISALGHILNSRRWLQKRKLLLNCEKKNLTVLRFYCPFRIAEW